MEKKPFVKINFKNCAVDYDYTICEWSEVSDYIQQCADDFMLIDESTEKPEITLSTVFMTDEEYTEWFKTNVEDYA